MIYNLEQKMQFLKDSNDDDSSKKAYLNLFVKLNSKVEKDFEKDVSEMNYEELKICISLLGGRDIKSIAWNISRLKQYVDWCIINGRTNTLENYLNIILPSDIDNSYIFKIETLKNAEQLEEYLNEVYLPVEECHLTNMYRVYMWLLYDGLTNTEAVNLERDQIDLENGIITVGDNKIEINPIFKKLLEVTLSTSQLSRKTRNGKKMYFDLFDTKYLLRGFKETFVNREKQFGAKITQFNKDYRNITGEYIRLSPDRIYESGLYYRWHILEQSDLPIPFDDYIATEMDDKEYSIDNKYVFTMKRKDIETSYNMWKKAFGY